MARAWTGKIVDGLHLAIAAFYARFPISRAWLAPLLSLGIPFRQPGPHQVAGIVSPRLFDDRLRRAVLHHPSASKHDQSVAEGAGEEEVRIHHDSGEVVAASLHNLWIQLRGVSGEEAAEAMERFARNCVADYFSGNDEGTGTVMPVVRNWRYVDALRERGFDPVCRSPRASFSKPRLPHT